MRRRAGRTMVFHHSGNITTIQNPEPEGRTESADSVLSPQKPEGGDRLAYVEMTAVCLFPSTLLAGQKLS